jgi:hypothetical protein
MHNLVTFTLESEKIEQEERERENEEKPAHDSPQTLRDVQFEMIRSY